MICDECQALYEEVGDRVRDADVFLKVRRTDEMLRCAPLHVEAETNTMYYAQVEKDTHNRVFVGLSTLDRWLSESIEADLVHTGDDIEELLEEELVDQGLHEKIAVQHYRDQDKRFVFQSTLNLPAGEELDGAAMIDRVTKVLLAYQACFLELGDMAGEDE